jgi:hypothetical protein
MGENTYFCTVRRTYPAGGGRAILAVIECDWWSESVIMQKRLCAYCDEMSCDMQFSMFAFVWEDREVVVMGESPTTFKYASEIDRGA